MSIENKIAELQKQIDVLREQQKVHSDPYGIADLGNNVYVLESSGLVTNQVNFGGFIHSDQAKQGRVSKNKQKLEHESKCNDLMTRLRVFADRVNGDWKPDWNSNIQPKHYILHSRYREYGFECGITVTTQNMGQVYFSTEKNCKAAIEHFGDELKILFFDHEGN